MALNRERTIKTICLVALIVITTAILSSYLMMKRNWLFVNLNKTMEFVDRYVEFGYFAPENRIFKRKTPSLERIIVTKTDGLRSGYLAVLAWHQEKGQFGLELFNHEGKNIHYWPVDYLSIFPGGKKGNIEPHGMKLMRDGSIVVNFDKGSLLARLDSCGKAVWTRTKDGAFHHTITEGDDGSMWTWLGVPDVYGTQHLIVQFDPASGAILRKINLPGEIIAKHNAHTVFGLPNSIKLDAKTNFKYGDIFHPNDVEPLTADLAPYFPQFNVGDLLISIRTPNLIAVLDGETSEVKWHQNGPWTQQHDPDFFPDGTITLFSNSRIRKSSIMSVNPSTGELGQYFADHSAPNFYSRYMGKIQYMSENTLLVTIPEEGRVLVVDHQGHTAFEFQNIIKEGVLGHVENAQWVPGNFFQGIPSCASSD